MKSVSKLLVVLFTLASFSVAAQSNLEDVIYTKGGNIYRGLVIEQVPGESMKIRIEGGSVFTVPIADIQKLTKEEKWNAAPANPAQSKPFIPVVSEREKLSPRYRAKYDSTYVPHYKKKRTYFFIAELRAGFNNGGLRIVNGYKVGRFGYFGAGIGLDGATFSNGPFGGMSVSPNNFSNGAYAPIYFRYAGDILKTRITPYYYAELGYAARIGGSWRFSSGRNYGGPMGALGFGCKFNTYRRINFNLNLNANWRTNFYNGTVETYDPSGFLYTTYYQGMDAGLFGNFSFGIGF